MKDFGVNLLVGSRFDEDTYPLGVIVWNRIDSFLDRGIIPGTWLVHIYGLRRMLVIGNRSARTRCNGNEQETRHQVKDKFKSRHRKRVRVMIPKWKEKCPNCIAQSHTRTSLIADEQKLKMATNPKLRAKEEGSFQEKDSCSHDAEVHSLSVCSDLLSTSTHSM